MPWSVEYPGAAFATAYLAELATPARDLTSATGEVDRLDSALVVPALAGARTTMRAEHRNTVARGSPFAAEVSPPPGAATGNYSSTLPHDTHGHRSTSGAANEGRSLTDISRGRRNV